MTPSGFFKAVPPSGVTRGTLDWNVPSGTVIRCDHDVASNDHGEVCPRHEGDGVTVAKTWRGAAMAGFPTSRCCTVSFDPADVLAEDYDKVRVRAVTVGEWFDAAELLRQGWGRGANLYGANLVGANLCGADFTGANLSGANLWRADLWGANLTGADLTGVDLSDARLAGVNLSGARLYRTGLGSWERGPDGYAEPKAVD